jgi:uncharacterized repeat protein (TIGR03847 family)
MPRIEVDLNPVTHITTDAIGKPGQRVFYVQGWQGDRVVTVIVEKVQIQSLAVGIEQFVDEIKKQYPNLSESTSDFDATKMRIQPPVDPIFRAGEMGLAYDADQDLLVLVVREVLTEGQDAEEAGVVRYWCTRSQLLALCRWGIEVAEHGRPLCPQCGEPMDPEGHFCPKKNGHKH